MTDKGIISPLIWEASNCITDEYWQKFFSDLSRGRNSKRIYVSKTHVTYNTKKVSFSYKYDDKAPEQIALELRKIISESLCLFSKADQSMDREDYKHSSCEFKEAITEDNWKKIKNKKMKDHLIFNYVIQQKERFTLTWEQAREAYNLINNSIFLNHTIKSKDIHMVNGEIASIDGIEISAELIVNHKADLEVDTDTPVSKKISLAKEWVKVCTHLTKKAMHLLCLELSDEQRKKPVKGAPVAALEDALEEDEEEED
jgi:hypothetical protein